MMKDINTGEPIYVSTDGTAGPYIMVPLDQLDAVRALLAENGVQFWVDEVAISVGDRPHTAVVNLGRGGDADAVQEILDAADGDEAG